MISDTDSIIFVSKEGQADPPTGNNLGELTNELPKGRFIKEFISVGAKSYSYALDDGTTVTKFKGFTLNGQTSNDINMKSMVQMLLNDDCLSVAYPETLKRDKATFSITNTELIKRCKTTYDKRRIVDADWNTLPFGYKSK